MSQRKNRVLLLLVILFSTIMLYGQGLETFDNFDYTGVNYIDGDFVGENGVVWNYVHVTGEQSFPIDGSGMLLRRSGGESTIISQQIPGGIGDFSVQLRKAFTSTGVRQVELFVNGESKGLSLEFGSASGADDTIHLFDVYDINIEGPITIEIRHVTGGDQNRQLVIDNITWTGYSQSGLPTVATPVFSPPGGSYFEPQFVVISTATEGATIYYTTDGSNPTEESPVFVSANPIEVNESMTIRARAFKEEMDPSIIASANYNLIETVDVPDLATLRTMPQDDTIYRLSNEVVLTYRQSFRNQKYVQDATAAILIDDDSGVITTSYNVGDGISNLSGTISEYGNMLQFVPIADPGPATTGNSLIYSIITAEQFVNQFEDYEAQVVLIKDVSFTDADGSTAFDNGQVYAITDGTATIDFRTTFYDVDYIGDVIPTYTVHLAGILNARSEGNYITARNWGDINEAPDENTVAAPVLTPPGGQYMDSVQVTMTTLTEGAQIYYTIDGNEPTESSFLFSDPVLVSENVTIKARAFKEGMNPSNITSAAYKIGFTTIAEIRDNFQDYNGQTVTIRGVVTIGSGKIHGSQLRAYIQDESDRGLMLFDYTADGNIQRGHSLEATGTIGQYQGVVQLTDFEYTILEENLDITDYIIPLTIPQAQNFAYWEGTMVEVAGKLYETPYYAGGGYNVNIEDAAGQRLTVRVWDSTGIDVSRLITNMPIIARGPVGLYNNVSQLLPGYQEDITIDIAEPVVGEVIWEPLNQYVDTPYIDQDIIVTAEVFDYDGEIETVMMRYRLESATAIIDTLTMSSIGNDKYLTTLPSLDTHTTWEDNYIVTIVATDDDGNVTESSHRIRIRERRPIVHSISFSSPEPGDSLAVEATILIPQSDRENSIAETRLDYYLNYRTQVYTTTFEEIGGNRYRGHIPGQPAGTIVQAVIFAADQEGLYTEQSLDADGNELLYTYPVYSHEALLRIPPKVFNPWEGETISIGYFSEIGNKAIIRIYNAEGKLVFTPKNELLANQNGVNYYHWDGKDRNRQSLPMGLYICHLETIDRDTGKKKTANAPIVLGSPLK
jgi:hypothetical protein